MATSTSEATAEDIALKIKADIEGQDDWRACGSEVYLCVQECLDQLKETTTSQSISRKLSYLLRQAQDVIKSVHYTKVHRKWRRLYTDVCILKGFQVLFKLRGANHQDEILEAIKNLDMAIIVCGAPGLDRLDMVHQEIALLQRKASSNLFIESTSTSCQESISVDHSNAFCLASTEVKELPSMPSLSAYLSQLHAEPFIVRNFASDWPAIQDNNHKWADGSYLSRMGGPGRVVPVEVGLQYTEADWYQDVIPWQDFLEVIGWTKKKGEDPSSLDDKDKPRYLAQHNLFRQFPALELDIIIPDIVYSCPPAPQSFSDYKPPNDEDGLETTIINAWIGPKGTTTPAHFDPYYNAYVQVVGQKLVWLAPPDVFSPEDAVDGNTSTLDIFDESIKGSQRAGRAHQMGMKAVLGPGDILILPPGWWHAMRSLSRCLCGIEDEFM